MLYPVNSTHEHVNGKDQHHKVPAADTGNPRIANTKFLFLVGDTFQLGVGRNTGREALLLAPFQQI